MICDFASGFYISCTFVACAAACLGLALHNSTHNSLRHCICCTCWSGVEPIHVCVVCRTETIWANCSRVIRVGQALGDSGLVVAPRHMLCSSDRSYVYSTVCRGSFGYGRWHCPPPRKETPTQKHWTNSQFWIENKSCCAGLLLARIRLQKGIFNLAFLVN